MTAVFFVMRFDVAPIVIWIFEFPLDQEIRGLELLSQVAVDFRPRAGAQSGRESDRRWSRRSNPRCSNSRKRSPTRGAALAFSSRGAGLTGWSARSAARVAPPC